MKNCLFTLIILITLLGCKQNKTTSKEQASKDSTNFFALKDFFKEQMVDVDLKNYEIKLHREINGKKDSSKIDKDQFSKLASGFLDKDISSPEFHSRFTESVFHDLSTKSYTLNYRPKSVEEQIQNIDILLDENSKLVKRIFMRVEFMKADTSVIEQWNWKANNGFQINKFSKTVSGFVSNEFNAITWDETKK